MDLFELAMVKGKSGGQSTSDLPFIVLEFDDGHIINFTWEELVQTATVVNTLTNVRSRNMYSAYVVKNVEQDSYRTCHGGIWHCVDIDAEDGGFGDVTKLYFASLTGGVYPTQDRTNHEQKYLAWDLQVEPPSTQGGHPVVDFLGTVGPLAINN